MKLFSKFLLIFLLISSWSCSPKIVEHIRTEIQYRDSIVVHRDTVSISVPVEKVVEIVPEMDTLRLETSVARAEAYVDTSFRAIRGHIENKNVNLEKEIQYIDRYITRDSLVIKEVPVEVERPVPYVPKIHKICLWVVIVELFLLALKFFLNYKGLSFKDIFGIFKK